MPDQDPSNMLHGRVSKVEARVEGVVTRLDGITERLSTSDEKHDRQHAALLTALDRVHSRIEKKTTPPIGLWLTAIGLAFTIAGAFVAIIAWFYAAQMDEMNNHLEQIDEIVLYTNSTRFTAGDGKELNERQHKHEATIGHQGMIARMEKVEAALTHRRDEADTKFLRVDERLDQLAVDIYRHANHTEKK